MRALLIAATLLFLTIPSRFGATGVSYTLATLLMFGAHIISVAIYPCRSTKGGASLGPLITTCVIPNRVGISLSSYGTGHDFIAAS